MNFVIRRPSGNKSAQRLVAQLADNIISVLKPLILYYGARVAVKVPQGSSHNLPTIYFFTKTVNFALRCLSGNKSVPPLVAQLEGNITSVLKT